MLSRKTTYIKPHIRKNKSGRISWIKGHTRSIKNPGKKYRRKSGLKYSPQRSLRFNDSDPKLNKLTIRDNSSNHRRHQSQVENIFKRNFYTNKPSQTFVEAIGRDMNSTVYTHQNKGLEYRISFHLVKIISNKGKIDERDVKNAIIDIAPELINRNTQLSLEHTTRYFLSKLLG